MRLLMAVSGDGFLCRDRRDDMTWTGRTDKALFRALTSVGGTCAVGMRTWNLMPRLPGRSLIPISRDRYTLARLRVEQPDAWLLGGPTVAKAALVLDFIDEVHLVTAEGVLLGEGCPLSFLGSLPPPDMETMIGDVVHSVRRL